MKKYVFCFFIFLFILVSTNIVTSVGFSPINLDFEVEQNQEACKVITIESDSEIIKVSDKWAENKDIEWKVSNFDQTADYHGLTIYHPSELTAEERQVNVCLSGNQLGEYHGVVLMQEEQEGNSIVQMGVWIKAIIIEPPILPTYPGDESGDDGGSAGGGSSGGGGGGGGIVTAASSEDGNESRLGETETQVSGEEGDDQETNQEEQEEINRAGITGSAVIDKELESSLIYAGIVLVVIGIIFFIIYKYFKSKKGKEEKEE